MGKPVRMVVRCPDCGVVRVPPTAVAVRWCLDVSTWEYRTVCSRCDTVFVAPMRVRVAHRALDAGATLEMWTLPAEIHERPAGEPITAADIIELRATLTQPDWMTQLRE
jgi:hypothetical protein